MLSKREAEKIAYDFKYSHHLSESEEFQMVEAFELLATEYKSLDAYVSLAFFYLNRDNYPLTLKYAEKALESFYDDSYATYHSTYHNMTLHEKGNAHRLSTILDILSLVYYSYGTDGTPDYKKAYEAYMQIPLKDLYWNCLCNIADMYRYGYYLEQSMDGWEMMLTHIYDIIADAGHSRPEIEIRWGDLRTEQGDTEEALAHYQSAKEMVSEYIGTINNEEYVRDYQALYGEHGIWVRPAAMWNETVERDGKVITRFTYIGE